MRPSLQESRLFAFLRGSLVLLIVPLAGCTLGASKQAAAPLPPKPAAVQPPAPDPPLSIPQTAVVLPSPQPINPDAIPPVPQPTPVQEKTEAPPATKAKSHIPAGTTKAGQDTDPEPEAPPTPVVQESAPIQPILSGIEQKRIQDAIGMRKREIAGKLGRAKGGLSIQDRSLVDRIQSFLKQCDDAEKRSDYSQADALSERALVLARELQVE